MRRIVTGHDKDGKSIIVFESEPPNITKMESLPGMELIRLWGTKGVPKIGSDIADPTINQSNMIPGPGNTHFAITRLPSQAEVSKAIEMGITAEKFRREYLEKAKDLAESHEQDNPGKHTTSTVDYVVVLMGEVELELDEGRRVQLSSGDVVIQNGTRHSWRNLGDGPCYLASVMVGATR